MKIIGLTSNIGGAHDSSAALLIDKNIIFAESEERVSRIKHDRNFPDQAISHALSKGHTKLSDIDFFASGIPPIRLFPYLLTYLQGLKYTNLSTFLNWLKFRFGVKIAGLDNEGYSKNLRQKTVIPEDKIVYIAHHLAHAETAYSFSGFNKCLVVAWDGHGIDDDGKPLCGTIYLGENDELKKLEELPSFASLPLYYGAFTIALGFKLNDGEGKTMGLAAYGKADSCRAKVKLIVPFFDGKKWQGRSNWLDINSVFNPTLFVNTKTYKSLQSLVSVFGNENVAAAIQEVLEEESEKFFRYLIKKYGQKDVAAAGGIFLNVKMNMRLLDKKIINNLFVYPNPSDGGVAVGAAIAAYKLEGGKFPVQKMERADLGCEFSSKEIQSALKSFKNEITFKKLDKNLAKITAQQLVKGKVIGWFQGRGEWGPRALGQRSVLADPRFAETKERINSKLKKRDWFMPFAPAIMSERANEFLMHERENPFMIIADTLKPTKINSIPAATHIDNTLRPQVVKKNVLPLYHQVIEEFYKITGVPVLLNTSFNRHGLPVVHSPKDAIEHLIWGAVDELVIGNFYVKRINLK